MASTKVSLKAIKAALDAGDFVKAADQAQNLIKQDNKNYNAFISLGFASEKLNKLDDAESALRSASQLKPQDAQAYKGLITLYEKQGSSKLNNYHDTVLQLGQIYAQQDKREQCQDVVDKYELYVRKHGTRAQYRKGLGIQLPTSELYDFLEGRIPHPSQTYLRILESAEAEEQEWINTQIGERRTIIGNTIDKLKQQVKTEAIKKFDIESKYATLIDWTMDDDARHDLEERLLQRAYENLIAVPADQKQFQRDRVVNTANGMVIIKHKFALAWKITLEWLDAESLSDWDVNCLRDFISFFPDEALTKVLRGFLASKASPFPQIEDEETEQLRLSEANQLILMSEGTEDCANSMLANRIMAEVYLSLDEHQSAAEHARKAQKLYRDAEKTFAITMRDSIDAVNVILGNALIIYQSPRYHPEAKALFNDILQRKPKLTSALLGIGLVLEEDEDYDEAVKFLQQAYDRDPSNMRVRLELSWCRALDNDLEGGLEELMAVLGILKEEKSPDLDMKAEVLYRIAYCLWQLRPASSARKDRSGPYQYLIDSVKINPNYAPAYTLLGVYFQDYGKSKQRARVALQKAFELSTSELLAAERLATTFANTREWDLVELVAKRVVDSGKAKPAPGSKKKAYSWPYAALGMVQLNKQQFAQSIVSFQAALRISPDDYHCWVGLGESYHNSGRFIAASRAFAKAESIDHGLPDDQTWFAKYMLANVQREMGSFGEAIAAYEAVLIIKPDEYGVLIALLQSLADNAWSKVLQGMYGEAVKMAKRALDTAIQISKQCNGTFNMWKATADACAVLSRVKAYSVEADIGVFSALLGSTFQADDPAIFTEIDRIDISSLQGDILEDTSADRWVCATILANKRAIQVVSQDIHAQAVSWFNLGWSEHQAYISAGTMLAPKGKKPQRFLKVAVRCFKHAIELEASNSEFWNALGVVTMTLNPKVSQHAFVRSVHLNDRTARTWTNLGVLYLIHNDIELANEAFTRAQSTDPDYAEAWIGQGLIATLYGNQEEANGLFTHAFEIADSSLFPAKRHYAVTAFDHLIQDPTQSVEVKNLLDPLLAMRQLSSQKPDEIVTAHLKSLFAERVTDFDDSVRTMNHICDVLEAEYEKTESNELLARFAQAKADLARAQLCAQDYENAVENGEMALDLSSEDDLGSSYAEARKRWRLSAHITAGVAHSYAGTMDKAIRMFKVALQESDQAPEVVCMLAQVLWAKGGVDEKETARAQLFECIEKHPENVQAMTLLAVLGVLDGDQDILDAVEGDLKALRLVDSGTVPNKTRISRVLAAVIRFKDGKQADNSGLSDALQDIMVTPAHPEGWLDLARVTGNNYAARMAVENAERKVVRADITAKELSQAYEVVGREEEMLKAKMVAPWLVDASGYTVS